MICARSGLVVVAIVASSCSGGRSTAPAPATGPVALAPARGPDSEPAAPAPPTAPAPPPASPGASAGSEPAAASPAPSPPAAPTVKVTLGDVGLEASSLDRTADPCVDFYQFACGGWIQNNPIPPDRAEWSRVIEVDERNQLALKAVLDDAARGVRGSAATRKLGEFYASCLDEAAIERGGTTAIKPVLARTLAVKDAASWLAALIELHKLGIWAVWTTRVAADPRNPTTNLIHLDAATLGLPGRHYYLRAEFADELDGYQRHVGKLLAVAGAPADAAAQVVAIETELALLSQGGEPDLARGYKASDVLALARQVKAVDWPRYFQVLGVPPAKRIIVVEPAALAGLDKLRAKFKPAAWASYFTYRLVAALAFALPQAYDDEVFALARLVSGVERERERGKRCVEATAGALGELLGQEYVTRYFPDSSRQSASQLVDALVKALADQLAGVDWLADATKQAALAKLGKLIRMIGYPERWKPYDVEVRRDDFAGNVIRAAASQTRRELARLSQPAERGSWPIAAHRPGAYYDRGANLAVVSAGLLQPPFFGQDRAIAANLGGIGMIIGRELSRGFDDLGAQFDGDGGHKPWWQDGDHAKFSERGKCVADEYAGFEALPRKFIHGAQTQRESIADLGGVRIAYRAYRALRKDAARLYVADGLSEDQQFFLAVGQAWCGRERTAVGERRLTIDAHAPAKFRIYGTLRNLHEFADAFRCVPGTPMRPARTCQVW